MERAQLLERLAEVRRRVASAEARIAEQRKVLSDLARQGARLTKAKRLLQTFEKIQGNYLRELDRLLDDLDKNTAN